MPIPIILQRMSKAEKSLNDAIKRISTLEAELKSAKDRILVLETTSSYNILNPYASIKNMKVYKMQPHCHTSPESADSPKNTNTLVADTYKSKGYNIICATNHDIVSSKSLGLGDKNNIYNGLLIMDGIEEQLIGNRHLTSICAKRNVGTAEDVGGSKGSFTATEAINMHKNDDAYIGWSHPTRENGSNFNTIYSLPSPDFIEIINNHANTNDEKLLDNYLMKGIKVHAMATDDCHDITNTSKVDKAWIQVYSDTLSVQSIKESLKAGRYYASTGNDMNISMTKDKITVTSSNDSIIEAIANGQVVATSEGTVHTYILNGTEKYVRFRSTLKSDTSKKAYSNPILLLDNFNV